MLGMLGMFAALLLLSSPVSGAAPTPLCNLTSSNGKTSYNLGYMSTLSANLTTTVVPKNVPLGLRNISFNPCSPISCGDGEPYGCLILFDLKTPFVSQFRWLSF